MVPMDAFVHEFTESENPQETLEAEADVIFADLQGMDAAKAAQDLGNAVKYTGAGGMVSMKVIEKPGISAG